MPSSVWTLKSLVLFLNAGKRKKNSVKTAKSILKRNQRSEETSFDEIVLSDEIWSIICDNLNPLEILRMRRVNRQLNRIVTERLNSLIYFDVLRCESAAEVVANNPENEFYCVSRNLYIHMDERSVIIVTDFRWTVRDIQTIWGAIQFFAPYARSLTIDSSLLELTIAALSSIKLTRFYAFICYVNAVGTSYDSELHIKLTELTVRAASNDMTCLGRICDYGVQFDAICSTEMIELVRCALLEPMGRRTERTNMRFGFKRPQHHLRCFKEWIDSDNLKEKYVQQYTS